MKKYVSLSLAGAFLLFAGCQSVDQLETEVAQQAKADTGVAGADSESAVERVVNSSLTGIASDIIPRAEMLDETPLKVDQIVPEDEDALQDTFVVPERKDILTPTRDFTEYPRDLIQGMKDPKEVIEVAFSLDATPLNELVPMFATLLDFSYIVDPGVSGAVTMSVDSKMTGEEVWELFEHLLWLSGAYASPNPGFVHVLPFSKMATERRLLGKHKPQPNVQVQLVPVFNTTSAEMAGMLQPFMTPGATANNIARLNSLLLVEAPLNMRKLLELIEILDAPGEAQWPQITVRCNEVEADVILEEMKTLMPILGFPISNQTPSGGALKMTALPRLQVIVASAALKDVLGEVERWVRLLDHADASAKEDVFFYNVRHRVAADLSEMLGVFFNASATTTTRTSQTQSTSTQAQDTRRTNNNRTTNTASRRQTSTSGEVKEPADGSIFETPVVIYVDDVLNRLTIRTTQRAYAAIRALLERQDVSVRQVMIEAIIAEITLGKSTEFGFAYAAKHSDWAYAYNGTNTKISSSFLNPSTGDSGTDGEGDGEVATPVSDALAFTVDNFPITTTGVSALMMKDDVLAFVKAVAGASNTKVISAPQILATNGQEARIEVGKEVAVKTTEYYGDTDDRTSYEYKNTGTILTVTPYITAGNQVSMEVEQEVSSVIESTRAELDSPDISRKNLSTTLSIPDGGTIMMGGLIDTLRSESNTGIPFLKDIPYLGGLFRSSNKNQNRQELLVLITVHVVDPASPNATEQLARRFKSALKEIQHQFKEEEEEE